MAHDHPLDIKPAPARTSQSAGCGACCGASEHAPAAAAPIPLGGGQRFRVPAMDCASEESEIRRAVEGIPGILGLRFQLGERSLRIDGDPQAALEAAEAIRRSGFEVQVWPEVPASGDASGAPDQAHDHDAATGSGLPRLLAALARRAP